MLLIEVNEQGAFIHRIAESCNSRKLISGVRVSRKPSRHKKSQGC